MLDKKAFRMPSVITIVFATIILTISLTASVLFAALSVERDFNTGAGSVADLSVTINSGSITINNEMDCVVRASPLAAGVTFASNIWFLQDNGWYYYYKVVKATDANKTIAIAGASSTNVAVELMQAQYLLDTDGTPAGGFIMEWAERDMKKSYDETLGGFTSDGLDISCGATMPVSKIVMYSGHYEDRRIPPAGMSNNGNHFMATNKGGYYAFDKVNLSDTADNPAFESMTDDTAIAFYNNAPVSMVYIIQVINGGHEPTKDSTFSNGNWTTYLDTAPSDSGNAWVPASGSSATSGYTTYFVSNPVGAGEYVTLTNGSDNQLYFDLTDPTTSVRFSVTGIDVMSFYYKYLGQPTLSKYLAWLQALDTNTTGTTTFYSDFEKFLANTAS